MSKLDIMHNREISWLAFNERVLQEAADANVPLTDRLRFLGIFSNNLDEFFRVRIATVQRMVVLKTARKDFYEKPKQLLEQLHQKVLELQNSFEKIFNEILTQLRGKGVYLVNEKQINQAQKKYINEYFKEHIRPTLVPLMLDQVKDFPALKDKSIYFAIKLYSTSKNKSKEYALLEIPTDTINRFLRLPSVGSKQYIMMLDDVIRLNLMHIFPTFGYEYAEAYTIKLTRDAELDIDNDVSQSFIDKLYKSVKNRQKGIPVRFVYDKLMPKDLFDYLLLRMKIKKDDNLIPGGRYHNFKDFMKFPDLGINELSYPAFQETYHPLLSEGKSFFSVLKKQDIMLHYPYQTFSHFIDFLREAATDKNVKSIKMTLYRAASKSKVINALISAANNGKKVTLVIELQARFDEEANIKWGRILQEEGVEVIYGITGLKIHSKLCLIERIEKKKRVLYANISTGNYNEQTSHTYSDQALFTNDLAITKDVQNIFEYIKKPAFPVKTQSLILSPIDTRKHFLRLIDREIRIAKKGKPASLFLKMNSIVDEAIIRKLYEASKAGVKCRLIVRGICNLKAGVAGMSENIEIISIIDRFLEHSRIFIFSNDGKPDFYISSSDFMTRNLDVRLEVSCPIKDEKLKTELLRFMELQWQDNVKARWIDKTLSNERRKSIGKKVRSQIEIAKLIQTF
jgi:polyphosphate kinase